VSAPAEHWTERLPGGRAPHAAWTLWVGVTLALLALWLVADALFGRFGAGVEAPGHYWWRRGVVAAITGWIVASSRWAWEGDRRDLDALRPLLRAAPADVERLRRDLASPDLRGMPACALAGAAIGLAFTPLLQADPLAFLRACGWDYAFLLGTANSVLLFALLGRELWGTLAATRVFARLESMLGEIDLLDPDLLEPFAQRGLRAAAFWIIGSAFGSLLFVSERFAPGLLAILAATLAVGVAALVLPMRGAHRRIRAEKTAELARVRAAIRAAREKLHDAVGAPRDARLAELLAWESRIERVREWPLDLPTLLRFGGLVLLAIGSWLGGAIAERVLAWLVPG
jgi:hypothetical protein